MDFKLVSEYKPTGDQPKAIESLVKGVEMGLDDQVLLGVTGSGKTFTMANVIAELNRPTLVLAHNKTLAAQLCSEFREFFPENAVEYFISYYDYYQPEAYIAHTDTYIEKDSAINDEIERLRHSATSALSERRDVIVVSSVSCIYGLGDPIDYKNMVISLRTGQTRERDELMRRLTDIRYERNDMNFTRNTFRVRGDTLEIYPAYWAGRAIRVEFFGDEIDRISEINAVTGVPERVVQHVAIYPASHYVASKEKMARAMHDIEEEMWQQVKFFESHDKLLEAQRIRQRTQYDLEMLSEIGFCTGIENYSRVIAGRAPGTPPTISCCSWTRATSRCRRCARCTTATTPASRVLLITASACRQRTITDRSNSTSSKPRFIRRFSSRQHPATTSVSTRQTSPSSSSAPRGFLTRRSSSARSKGRSTI